MNNNTCDVKNLPKECAMNFKILEVKLETIRNNDIKHLDRRIQDVASLVKAILIIVLGGFLGVVLNLVF